MKEDEKKITIVVPVYNSEKYIGRCLDSILKQTVNNFKVLVINDGSVDKSQEIINKYKEKYPNIIETIIQENIGVARTRNKAIKIAKTEYIMFIDNDDYIDKDYVEVLYNNIEKNKMDVILSGYRRPDENQNIITEVSLSNTNWSKFMVMAPWSKIFRTEYLLKNNIEFLDNNIGEDIFFNLIAFFETSKIKIIDYVGYNWFYNTKSVSNTSQKDITQIDVYKLLNSCYDELKERKILEKNYELIEAYFIRYIDWFIMYSTVGAPYKIISQEYNKLFIWLKERFPNYKRNKVIGFNFKKPYGEKFNDRKVYFVFGLAKRIGLGRIFVYIYSRCKKIKEN